MHAHARTPIQPSAHATRANTHASNTHTLICTDTQSRIQYIQTEFNLCLHGALRGNSWLTGKSFLQKHPSDREKHQMQELKASHRNRLSILHMKANLSILCSYKSGWESEMKCLEKNTNINFSTRKLNALRGNPGANHKPRSHANVS